MSDLSRFGAWMFCFGVLAGYIVGAIIGWPV